MNRPDSTFESAAAATSTVPPVSEMYSRVMQWYRQGYPLYSPGPGSDLPLEYRKKGVGIGDVGVITPDGAFHFFFNVDAFLDSAVNPSALPADFETIWVIEDMSSYHLYPGESLVGGDAEGTEGTLVACFSFIFVGGSILENHVLTVHAQAPRLPVPFIGRGGTSGTRGCYVVRGSQYQ